MVWFWIGICWIGAGIPLAITERNWGIFAIGIVFAVLGLANKDKWKKNHVKFKDLTPIEKQIKSWLIIILAIIVLFGFVAFLILGF